jgi:hypothetical protein
MFDKPTKHSKKIFRGAYNYIKKEGAYAEENFEVYRDGPDQALHFLAKFHSRVSTGELFSVDVHYNLSKDYQPIFLTIKRSMGTELVQEIFDFNPRKATLNYIFISDDEEISREINTPPKFHLTAPVACSSMVFLRSKKFDATSKNYYTFMSSSNQWKYEQDPFTHNITVQRITATAENIVIDGNNLQAIDYKMIEDSNADKDDNDVKLSANQDSLKISVSPYITIPYLLRSPDGTKVQIKFLNNLTDKD